MKLKFVATEKLITTLHDRTLSFFLSKESTRRRTCRRILKLLNSQALKLDWIHGKKSKKPYERKSFGKDGKMQR
jgi:hypothetical protein